MLVAGFTLIPPKYSLIELSFSPLTMAKGNQLTLEGFAAERSGLQNYVVYVLFFAAGISFVAFMDGEAIGWGALGLSLAKFVVLKGGLAMFIAVLVFRRRELAAVTV